MRFAKIVFTVAGIWGFVVLTPLYFSYDAVGALYPPSITHPDFFYGFVGVALVWKVVFLMIGRDPERLHAMMIPAILEKFVYVSTLAVLYLQGRLASSQFAVAVPDLTIGVLFVVASVKVAEARRPAVARAGVVPAA